MTQDQKGKQENGKAGKAGKWTSSGFIPSKPAPKKKITLLDILLGRK